MSEEWELCGICQVIGGHSTTCKDWQTTEQLEEAAREAAGILVELESAISHDDGEPV